MERGLVQGPQVVLEREPIQIGFLVPGTPTPVSPIKAFQQGLRGEGEPNRLYEISGMRCSECGYLEFYAITKRDDWR